MQIHIGNWIYLFPSIWIAATAIVVLMLGVSAAKNPKGWIEHFLPAHYIAASLAFPSLILFAWNIVLSLNLVNNGSSVTIANQTVGVSAVGMFFDKLGNPQLYFDPFACILAFLIMGGTLLVMLLSIEHFGEFQPHKGEYYSLLLFAGLAASLACAASDLLVMYLTIEFLSLVSYVLAGYAKKDLRSGEASIKYFLYGAACSAIMLYGISILFGISGGSTTYAAISQNFTATNGAGPAAAGIGWVAIAFVMVGMGFKIALVPFHFWAPDVYEGAPTPVTAFLSVVSKAAGLGVLVRFITVCALPSEAGQLTWYWMLWLLSIASMFYGNLTAIWQTNIKRMLAYSSIAQIGYMMIAVVTAMHSFKSGDLAQVFPGAGVRADVAGSNHPWDIQGLLVYVLAYLFTNLGAFGVVVVVSKHFGSDKIESYTGLWRRAPLYAGAMAIFMLSLAGIPFTAGFVGKLMVFGSAILTGSRLHWELLVLAALGVINSIISAYYYLNIVRLMYIKDSTEQETKPANVSTAAKFVVSFSLAAVLLIIFFMKPISDLTTQAVINTATTIGNIVR